MKNLMVANLRGKGRYTENSIEVLLKAQIENSLDLGWLDKDMIVITNFPFEFMGIKSVIIDLNKFCWTGSKMFGLQNYLENNKIDDVIWAHDLDAWQNAWFDCPEFKDVGGSYYSRPKFNGGSIFWKESSKDIIDEVVNRLKKDNLKKEEPTLNEVFKSDKYKDRVTVLNETYNVGCSGYVERYERSIKPIKVCHFHPYNRIAWETHSLDRNGLGVIGITSRLERILRKYYPGLATELSEEGKKRSIEKREAREQSKAKAEAKAEAKAQKQVSA